ncbi:MAG TPA: peptidase [Deltaproteobacteria bacterium]|nr:peptidase [Deltaproteobacteria bacterium]
MRKKYSIKTLFLTAFFSAVAGLGIAVQLDWLQPSQAENPPAAAPVLPSFLSAPPPVSPGQTSQVPSFAELARRVQAAVVNISTSKTVRASRFPGYPQDFFERFQRGTPAYRQNSLGSGFILNKDGYILTNNHVISGADQIQVKLSDGRTFDAQVVGSDPKTDISVIKIDAHDSLPVVYLGNSDALEIGDWVLAIGNPFGLTQTVTAGIVSAKGRVIGAGPYDDFIQTDASINPGNSGGPLFNLRGEVVGINTAVVASGQGLGFAIPINMVKAVIPQLIKGKAVERGYLGIGLQEVTTEIAQALGLSKPEGALVAQVYEASPAAQAGILPGDLILSFNGQAIVKNNDLPILVAQAAVGSESSIEVLRKGEHKSFRVKVASLEAPPKARFSGGNSTLLGVAVRNLIPAEVNHHGLSQGQGVMVTDIDESSSAAAVGVRPGDVILQFNDKPVAGSQEFTQLTQRLKTGQMVRLLVKRGPMTAFFAFKV